MDIFSGQVEYNDQNEWEASDDRFLWNGYMLKELMEYRSSLALDEQQLFDAAFSLVCLVLFICSHPWQVRLIHGYAAIDEYKQGESLKVGLVSRVGCKRAGARFHTRGIDDEGHVANYVEVFFDLLLALLKLRVSLNLLYIAMAWYCLMFRSVAAYHVWQYV